VQSAKSRAARRREIAALAKHGITIAYQLCDEVDPAIFVSSSLDDAIREAHLRLAFRFSAPR